jgi:hypothetical protein
MKKLLGIVVLGLLWCNISLADHYRILYKDSEKIHIQSPEHFGRSLSWKPHWPIATKHCKSYGKYWFQLTTKPFGAKIYKHYKSELKKMKGYIGEYLCSKEPMSKGQSITGKYRSILATNYVASSSSQSTASSSSSSSSQSSSMSTDDKITQSKQICRDLGFKTNTEKFADCALKMMSIQFEATNKVAASSGGTKQEIIIKHKNDYDIFDAMIDMSNAMLSNNKKSSSSSSNNNTRCVIGRTNPTFGTTTMNCR